MTKDTTDEGVMAAIIEEFEKHRLPRALEIKKHVDGGGLLYETDLLFLEESNKRVTKILPLIEHNPEWQEIYARAVKLHEEIVQQALENEKSQKS